VTVAVKICGVTRVADAVAAADAGADFVGLNFWPGSRRFVTVERARALAAALPPTVRTVGVFVNATEDEIERTAFEVGLALVQLHGDEPPGFLARLAPRLIRALRVGSEGDLAALESHPAALFLLDAPAPGYGGSGRRFDWSLAAAAHRHGRPFFLAGGLTPETVAEAVAVAAPFGVDVAGGVEEAPGLKDPALVRRFVAAAKGWIDR
jgi:phosphoribosylanthranilate isomerase